MYILYCIYSKTLPHILHHVHTQQLRNHSPWSGTEIALEPQKMPSHNTSEGPRLGDHPISREWRQTRLLGEEVFVYVC